MQRRAAAVSAALFVLVAAGAFATIGVASPPTVETTGGERLATNETFPGANGTEYTVGDVSESSATFTWQNASARYTATLENGSNVTYSDENFTVVIPNVSEPRNFTLREVQTVDQPTVTANGTTYVLVDRDGDGTQEAIPRDEYLGEQRTETFAVGAQLEYQNNTTQVADITASEVTLAWTGPKTLETSASAGENVTLGGETYLVYVQDGEAIVTGDFQGYQDSQNRIDYYHERINGLWGVVIVAGIGAFLLLALSYMPSRY